MSSSISAAQVRIDVFIRRGAPAAAAINELSLSSGASLHFHAEFAARLWTQFQPDGAHLPYPGAAAWEARAPGAALYDLGGPRAGAPTPNQNAARHRVDRIAPARLRAAPADGALGPELRLSGLLACSCPPPPTHLNRCCGGCAR